DGGIIPTLDGEETKILETITSRLVHHFNLNNDHLINNHHLFHNKITYINHLNLNQLHLRQLWKN
ncbi:hypothetical protein PIB30_111773, partial [Stylosanthes scabra]|nr:hypothetical protein [Stylosanthes scabra]